MKIIAIGGEPATGKTSLVKGVMENVGLNTFTNWRYKLVRGHLSAVNNLLIFGIYNDDSQRFSGTDRLSMGVMPDAIEMMLDFKDLFPVTGRMTVLFEGDRLFSSGFLKACCTLGETVPIVLKTSAEEKSRRHKLRKDTQTTRWLKSRETKLKNIEANFLCHNWQSETEADFQANLIKLLKLI